jgi:hypothetical protein
MKRDLLRSHLSALLSGLLLAACGGPTEEGLTPAEEFLGSQESAMCSGSTVSSLSILGVSSYGGEVAGSGSWAVTYPANAVHLDFLVDGVVLGRAEPTGGSARSGNWNFSYKPLACGSHTFEVRAYPMTITSTGERYWCPESGTQSRTQTFSEACPTAGLSCSRTSTNYISCTGSGTGGTGGPYSGVWRRVEDNNDTGRTYDSGWYQGSLTGSFYCPQKTSIEYPYNGDMTVSFKARDVNGLESAAISRSFICVF